MKTVVANFDNDWTLRSEEVATFVGEAEKNEQGTRRREATR